MMPPRVTRKTLALVLCLVTQSSAQSNITASTCVAPTAYTQCVNELVPSFESCMRNAGVDLKKQTVCACVSQLGQLNCAMANCWNVVYGCEYQAMANLYLAVCSSGPVPFFLAPDNAAGGCSCNLGYVLYNTTQVELEFGTCLSTDINKNDGCGCCAQAAGYAALYGICPKTSLKYIAYPGVEIAFEGMSPDFKGGQCASYFAKYDCNSLGFTGLSVPFMTSFNAATVGTQSISNTDTRTVTSPVSGATFTWTDLNLPQRIVAASANARVSSGSGSARNSVVQSSATQGSAGQSTTGAKSDAQQSRPSQMMLALLAVAVASVHAFF